MCRNICYSASFLIVHFKIIFSSFLPILFRIQVTAVKGTIVSETEVIQVQEKILLSVPEASQLFGIGQNRLREIVRSDYDGEYHLMVGRVIKIKRKPFEEYINRVPEI